MRQIDLQDGLLLFGVALIVGGIAAWSRPAAAIIAGLFSLFFAVLIQRARAGKETSGSIRE